MFFDCGSGSSGGGLFLGIGDQLQALVALNFKEKFGGVGFGLVW